MASVIPKTIGEALYWSYANLAMAAASSQHGKPAYQKIDYIIRGKLYYGLLRGTMKLGSFLEDEKMKMALAGMCCYCGSDSDLTLDHLIPKIKGGKHAADNLVAACRPCNSSKNARDLLEWMARAERFPPLFLLRRYLKLAIGYCVENRLMDVALAPAAEAASKQPSLFEDVATGEAVSPPLPFAISLLPFDYPDPATFRAWRESHENGEG